MELQHELIDPNEIELDVTNPRIQPFIGNKKPEELTPEDIHLALSGTASGINQLKTAIKLNKGLINPIVINKSNGKLVAIDGNTRLAIYKEFKEKNPENDIWKKIPCVVYKSLNEEQIDALRLQIHLIGPKEWKPYSKGRYLWLLTKQERIPIEDLVGFCGGSKSRVNKYIFAYRDMEDYYRHNLNNPDTEFNPQHYSYFEVLQEPRISNALRAKDYDKNDFAKWVINGKFNIAMHVRSLDKILAEEEPHKIFLKLGSEEAIKRLSHPQEDEALAKMKLKRLLNGLEDKLRYLSTNEVEQYANKKQYPVFKQLIEDVKKSLENFESDLDLFNTKINEKDN